MPTVQGKLIELTNIANASRGRFRLNKGLFISGIVLGVLSQVMSALAILILPAILLLLGGVVYGFVFRKSKEQTAALKQIKLLRQAVEDQWVAQGFDGAELRKFKQDYDNRVRSIEYDDSLQKRFQSLCQKAGVSGGGILVDRRLL